MYYRNAGIISFAKSSNDVVAFFGSRPGSWVLIMKCVQRKVLRNCSIFRATWSAVPIMAALPNGELRSSRADLNGKTSLFWRVVGFRQNLAIEVHHAEDVRLRFFPRSIFSFSQVDQTQLCNAKIGSVASELS
jgi:hypothetical protein